VFGRRKHERVPPNRDAVVDRVLCVSVVAMLGAIVAGLAEGAMDDARAGEYVAESHRWLRREQLADALTIGERHLIAKSLADWSERESVAAGWRSESAGVLLWALSAFAEMPPYEERFESLPSLVPLLAPTAAFRAAASLRSPEVIGSARDIAELRHGQGGAGENGSIALERHRALDWLCGYSPDWDKTPTGSVNA